MRSIRLIMRLFTYGLSVALPSFCFLGLTGCAEDNEAAINEQAAKTRADTIPADKISPPVSSQAEWAKRNAGLNPRVFFEYRRHAQKARTGCREKLIIRSRSATNPRDGVSSLLTSWLSCSVFRDDPNSLSVFFLASLPRHLAFVFWLGSSPGNTCPMGWDFLNCLFPPCWGGLSPQAPFHGGNRHGLSGYFVDLGHAM